LVLIFYLIAVFFLTTPPKKSYALYGAGPNCRIVSCGGCSNGNWFCSCAGCQCDVVDGGACQSSTKDQCLGCTFQCNIGYPCSNPPAAGLCFPRGGEPPPQPPTPTQTPTPTLYPTVAISGNLREYLRALCFNNISTSNISLNINLQYSAGITPACGITPPTRQTKYSYRCTVVFDNQRPKTTPIQNISLSASAYGYSFGYWSNPNNTCTANYNNVLTVNVSSGGSTVYNKDIYFSLNTPWIKLKDSSFSKIGILTNIVPLNIIAYDADNNNNNRYFIINNSSPPQTDPSLVSAA